LHDNWKVFLHRKRETPPDFTFPEDGIKAEVPGTVHTDLLAAGLIPDPFYGMNEKDLQWIGWNDWRYECTFDLPDFFNKQETLWLVFDGLDTVAEIVLNGRPLANVKNMFRSYRFKVNEFLKQKDNHLRIVFNSALQYGKDYQPRIEPMPSERHPDRAFVRKAQYSFGWDWGPAYPTCGIWRPVFLLQQNEGIDFVTFDTLELTGQTAKVRIGINLWEKPVNPRKIEIALFHQDQVLLKKLDPVFKENETVFEIERPELWQPNGEGNPALHRLEVRLLNEDGQIVDQIKKKVGIRKVELVTSENGQNRFYFKINDKRVYVKGVNWIPAHSFIPSVQKETYRRLLESAKDANMNMIRVWGGGIYEDEQFYELCDQLGLMVWQDFMFACASYPEDDAFLAEVEAELKENVSELRIHPSLVLWCGNNENEWIWYRDHCGGMEGMPGYRLFHRLMPEWLNKLDPYRPYWPTTPWGLEKDPNDERSGNRHVWHIWSQWVDYTDVKNDRSLFVSEFGFQAPAHYQTLKQSLPEAEFHVQSESFEWHNKQEEGPERLLRFLSAHLPVRLETGSFIYLTQLNQAFALKACLEHWRLNQPQTAGSVIWQLNDCWQVTSWALIDSDLRPKLSYYQVKKSFAQNAVLFKENNDLLEVHVQIDQTINGRPRVEINHIPDKSNEVLTLFSDFPDSLSSSLLTEIKIKELKNPGVILATLFDEQGGIISRNFFNLKPWKHLRFPDVPDAVTIAKSENGSFVVEAKIPCFFVELRHPKANFSEQGFILLPGEKKLVRAEDVEESIDVNNVEIYYLNRYLA